MIGIGTFAQFAGVSLRTLRYYDEVGLLRPAVVDASTGYRSYTADQFTTLNRILVLKELGFTLTEITRLTEAGVSPIELVGMLKLRRAEAERSVERERERLSRVAARINLIEGDPAMTTSATSILEKRLPAVRLACVSEPASGFDADFWPIFGRLWPPLYAELARLGLASTGPGVAIYLERSDGQIDVVAAAPISPDASVESNIISVRDLPAVERAATLIHHGAMADIQTSYAALSAWTTETGATPVGFSREIYLQTDGDQSTWVTELQFVLANG